MKTYPSVINYAVNNSSLGTVLVATTDKGLCAALLGETELELSEDLQRRFPLATCARERNLLSSVLQNFLTLVEGSAVHCNLPLDLYGTPLQQQTWRGLLEIPYGQTISYSALAQKLGVTGSVRAVANAVAANPCAIAVPCHRVVRTNGDLSGYRWGVSRKRELLGRESSRVTFALTP